MDGYFRTNNKSILTESISLPLWVVYSRTFGTSQTSFQLKEGSLSLTGLSKIADGVYQYSLQSPLQVEEGDIVEYGTKIILYQVQTLCCCHLLMEDLKLMVQSATHVHSLVHYLLLLMIMECFRYLSQLTCATHL